MEDLASKCVSISLVLSPDPLSPHTLMSSAMNTPDPQSSCPLVPLNQQLKEIPTMKYSSDSCPAQISDQLHKLPVVT
jgi:hypothetical protein